MLREKLPYDYLTIGHNMRGNIQYEIQEAKKQKEIDYEPIQGGK